MEKNSLKKFSSNPRCQPQMISFHIENKNKDKDKIKFIPRLLYYMNHPNQVTRIFPSTIPQTDSDGTEINCIAPFLMAQSSFELSK